MFTKLNRSDLSEINMMLVPLMIENLFIASIGLLISFFLKKTGAEAVAAVGLMHNIHILVNNMFISFGTGVSVTVAQYCGRRDTKATGIVALQGINMSVGIAIAIAGICFILRDPILALLLGESEPLVYEYCHTYFNYYLAAMPFVAMYTVGSAALRGSGFPRASLVSVIVYNGLYALLSGISTLGFDLGFTAVCRSQFSAAVIASIVAFFIIRKGNVNLKIERYTLKMDKEIIKPMLRVGVPVLVENVCFSLGRLVTQVFAVPYGTEAVAANGIVNHINTMLCVPVIGALSAAPPLIGRYCGMNDKETAMLRGKQLNIWVTYIEAAVSLIALFIIRPFAAIMNDSLVIQDLICEVIYVELIFLPIAYTWSFVLPAVIRSSGDARYVMIVNTVIMIVARIGVAYTLTHIIKMGIMGIWIGQYVDWIVRLFFFIPRFIKGKWLEYSIFDQ